MKYMLNYHLKSDTRGKFPSGSKLLTSFQRKLLQKSLQDDLPEQYRQRLEIMLLADEGKTQAEICKALGCCHSTARHWILIAKSGQAHNWQDSPIGRPKSVNEQYLERLKELVTQSPKEFGYSFRRWTANWLSKHLAQELGVEVTDRHINRLLKQMGLSTRPKPSNAEENISLNARGDYPAEGCPEGYKADALRDWRSSASAKGDRILIRDLQSVNKPDNSGMWLINLDKSGKGSDIYGYGSKFICSSQCVPTACQDFGAFSFGTRMQLLPQTS